MDSNEQLLTPSEYVEIRDVGESFELVIHHDAGETAHIPISSGEPDIAAALERAATVDEYFPRAFAEDPTNYVDMEGRR